MRILDDTVLGRCTGAAVSSVDVRAHTLSGMRGVASDGSDVAEVRAAVGMDLLNVDDTVDGYRFVSYLNLVVPEHRVEMYLRFGPEPPANVFGNVPRSWFAGDSVMCHFGMRVLSGATGICELPARDTHALMSEYVNWPVLWQSPRPLRAGGRPSVAVSEAMSKGFASGQEPVYGYDMRDWFGKVDVIDEPVDTVASCFGIDVCQGTSVCGVLGNCLASDCSACIEPWVTPQVDSTAVGTNPLDIISTWHGVVSPPADVPVALVLSGYGDSLTSSGAAPRHSLVSVVTTERVEDPGVDPSTIGYPLRVRSAELTVLVAPPGVKVFMSGVTVSAVNGALVAVVGDTTLRVSRPGDYIVYRFTARGKIKWLHSVCHMDPRDTFARFMTHMGSNVAIVRTGSRVHMKRTTQEYALAKLPPEKFGNLQGSYRSGVSVRCGAGDGWVVGYEGSVVVPDGHARIGRFMFDPDIPVAVRQSNYKVRGIGDSLVWVFNAFDSYTFDDGGPSDDEFEYEY